MFWLECEQSAVRTKQERTQVPLITRSRVKLYAGPVKQSRIAHKSIPHRKQRFFDGKRVADKTLIQRLCKLIGGTNCQWESRCEHGGKTGAMKRLSHAAKLIAKRTPIARIAGRKHDKLHHVGKRGKELSQGRTVDVFGLSFFFAV